MAAPAPPAKLTTSAPPLTLFADGKPVYGNPKPPATSGDATDDWPSPNERCINHTRLVFAKKSICPMCSTRRVDSKPKKPSGVAKMAPPPVPPRTGTGSAKTTPRGSLPPPEPKVPPRKAPPTLCPVAAVPKLGEQVQEQLRSNRPRQNHFSDEPPAPLAKSLPAVLQIGRPVTQQRIL